MMHTIENIENRFSANFWKAFFNRLGLLDVESWRLRFWVRVTLSCICLRKSRSNQCFDPLLWITAFRWFLCAKWATRPFSSQRLWRCGMIDLLYLPGRSARWQWWRCVCVCVCVCTRTRTHCMFFLFANSLWNMCLTTCQCVSGLVFHDWICSSECSSQSVHTLRRRCLVHIFRVRIKSKVTLQMHILRQLCSVFRCAVSLFVSGRICHHAVTRQCDDLAL